MQVDVAILGGGVAGCAMALALKRAGVDRLVVVEAGRYQGLRIGESIPPDASLRLESLGLRRAFEAEGHHPCLGSCSSWGADELGYNDFLLSPYGTGWHLDRARFDRWLADQVESAGIELRRETRYLGREEGEVLRLSDGSELTARFVVDATGHRAVYARHRGAQHLAHDQLVYLARSFEDMEDSNLTGLTVLEAVSYGWWYAARLPDGKATVAVASDPDLVREHRLSEPDVWLERFRATRHVSASLSHRRPVDRRPTGRLARSSLLGPPAGDSWLAVGDAASCYDPISAQGIMKGLDTGLRAAPFIRRWLDGERGVIGEYAVSVIQAFRTYLHQRAMLYGVEQRWSNAPFWVRRRQRRNLEMPGSVLHL